MQSHTRSNHIRCALSVSLNSPPSGWPLCWKTLGLRSWRKWSRRRCCQSDASHSDMPPSSCPANTHVNPHTPVSCTARLLRDRGATRRLIIIVIKSKSKHPNERKKPFYSCPGLSGWIALALFKDI